MIDDEEASTAAGTPQTNQEKQLGDTRNGDEVQKQSNQKTESAVTETSDNSINTTPTMELPPDVKAKLRKLERLEPKWQEFLRSYKIAHARVQEIERFEAALQENTPLTSIQDLGAFTEYLNQLRLKSDMVLEELKRVSGERDGLKAKLAEAEARNSDTQKELDDLRSTGQVDERTPETSQSVVEPERLSNAAEATEKSKSGALSLPGISLFSPKSKLHDKEPDTAESEEIFSYEDELPRVESELRAVQEENAQLKKEAKTLQNDLNVARESTQGIAKSLEESIKEATTLKEKSERMEADLASQTADNASKVNELHLQLETADRKLRELEGSTLQGAKDDVAAQQLEKQKELLVKANADIEQLRASNESNVSALANISKLENQIRSLEAEIQRLRAEKTGSDNKNKILNDLVTKLREDLGQLRVAKTTLETQFETQSVDLKGLQQKLDEAEKSLANTTSQTEVGASSVQNSTGPNAGTTAGQKKKNNKKKKGKTNEPQNGPGPLEEPAIDGLKQPSSTGIATLQQEVDRLKEEMHEKDALIQRLTGKIKDQDDLKEEIESLRDDLINVGQDHVVAKERIKELEAEKEVLEASISELQKELDNLRASHAENSAGSQQAQKDLVEQFSDLKLKATNLETDLAVAQQLASSRFKDLTDLRSVLQKAQPELTSLRKENSDLKNMKTELTAKVEELHKLESRQNVIQTELVDIRHKLSEKESESKDYQQKLLQETKSRQKAEEDRSKINQDLQRTQQEKTELVQSLERTSNDLVKTKDQLQTFRSRIREIEETLSKVQQEHASMNEEVQLKTAQYASAESLMNSMRDQTSEMVTQTKEARGRVESLEEEIADTHRLLNERNREAETMRRLLAEMEGRADTRIREMKDRMDVALEERDKAEDDASTASRRRARELEDLRSKLREVQRELTAAEQEKEELQKLQKDWKKQREDLEHKSSAATKEAEEIRQAMSALRDALDESEKQARDLEKQKSDLRRTLEETQQRLDRAQKSNKVMADEVKSIQQKSKPKDSQDYSARSSVDSSRPQSRETITSPTKLAAHTPSGSTHTINGQPAISTDYVKNFFLQFLEQKDKKIQMGLVPVLAMLLHFDKWVILVLDCQNLLTFV